MIKTSSLTKRYADFTAVDNISFQAEPGQVLGFLGPNGAGKSTTMKMLSGFLAPTSGTAEICGFNIETQALEAKREIGYLPEGAPSYGEMTPRRFLEFIAAIRGLSPAQRKNRLDDVIARLQLESVLDQSIDTLSKGFKRRVGLAQAIIHDPKVLLLDEPTDGLDPNQKYQVRELINSMSKDKVIVISTHILEEVHAVCNRAIIIAAGKLQIDATPAELEARSRYHKAVSLTTPDIDKLKQLLSGIADIESIEVDPLDNRLTAFPRAGSQILTSINEVLNQHQINISELQLESGRLDEVFRNITHPHTREVRA